MPLPSSAASRCRVFSAICCTRRSCCCRFSSCLLSSYSRGPPSRARRAPFAPGPGCGSRLRSCGGRQRRDRLDLDEGAVSRQAGNGDGGACWAIVRSEVAVAHLAKGRQVRAVNEIVVELHNVPELRADRGERTFQIFEGLHRLLPEVAADLAVAIDPKLTGDVDDTPRRGDLDHVGVAGRPSQRLRIDESDLTHAYSFRSRSYGSRLRLNSRGRARHPRRSIAST